MIATEPVGPAAGVRAAPTLAPSKVQDHQRQRLAVVYVRQSTAQQVLEHRESTALQYALRSRALEWGWSADRGVR